MKNCLAVVFAAAVAAGGLSSFGETWYWSPTVKGDKGYYWTNVNNWTNSAGGRGVNYPLKGDTAIIGAYGNVSGVYSSTEGGDSPFNRPLYEVRIGPAAISCNQGNYEFQGGGKGLQYLATSDCTGNYCGAGFVGPGEIPINISNNVTYALQMRIRGKDNPVIIKEGKGKFVCFNQGSTIAYTVPLTLIKQGSYDMGNKGGTHNNLTIGFYGNDSSQRLAFGYCGAYDLVLQNSAIIETNGVANAEHGIADANKGKQIVFTGTPKVNPMVFSGQFYQKAGLRWSPSGDAYTFVCSNAVSATTGKLTLEKGSIKLVTGASFTAASELSMSANTVFEVADAPMTQFHVGQLVLAASSSKVKVGAGVNIEFGAASLEGVALRPGTYSATGGNGTRQASWIEGEGMVTVQTGPSNGDDWKGGATGGTSALLGDNWLGGENPDLSTGEFFATFALGGTEASLPAGTAAKFNGITFDNSFGGNAFAFTAGDGASAELGENGLVAKAAAAATTWTMGWPLVVGTAQTWSLAANNTLQVNGGLSGSAALTVNGAGTVEFASPSAHSGALKLESGTVRVLANNGLGSSTRTVSFYDNAVKLSFGGDISVDSPISGTSSGGDVSSNGFSIEPNATVVFNGQVAMFSQHSITLGAGSTMILKGGYSASTSGMSSHLYPKGSGTVVVTNKPFKTGFAVNGVSGNPVNFDFQVAGNELNRDRLYNWSGFYGKITTRVANVFNSARTWIHLRGNAAEFDLDGHDQEIMWFHADAGCKVSSAAPALLTVNSTAWTDISDSTGVGGTGRVDRAVFSGQVGFKKTGVYPHTFGATSTSTGTIEVAGGDLLFDANGKWPNCMSVSATATGRLVLRNSEAFNEKATLSVATTAQLQLDGCTNKFDRLYVDGHRKGGGTYGAVGSGAKHEVNWITGNGLLDVAEHGLILFLR